MSGDEDESDRGPGRPPLPDAGGAPDGEDLLGWLSEEAARHARIAAGAVDPRRPLAAYALDSLAAVELMHAIETRTGVGVEMETLFSEMSLAELAASLRQGRRAAPGATPAAGGGAGDYRLSQGQLSLWFLHALAPASPAYHIPNAVRLRGEIEVAGLVAAFQALIARHPALRTTFPAVAGEPVQRVAARGALPVSVHDGAAWSEAELADRLAWDSSRPFDLAHGPLLRLSLYARPGSEWVLLLAMHHIVTDFWSLAVLLDELAALYAARRASGPPRLPAAAPGYAEFALWQESMLAGSAGETLWAWWRERLAGELPVLDLPSDRPRPPVSTTAGSAVRRALAGPLAGAVHRQARAAGATPFAVLLAAFAALLHRYCGETDLPLGTVSAARSRAAFARTAGYFVNPLVLRADLAGDPAFAALVARTRRDALDAFAHQDYPFPLLVERLQPRRDPSRSPLFQVLFVLQRAQLGDGQDLTGFALGEPGSRVELDGGLGLELLPLPQRIAQFDLTLTLGEAGGRLIASFDYRTDLFDAPTVERLAGHYERLLAAALADPGVAVSELALLGAAERSQLAAWNDTRVPYRDRASLARLFAEQAAATPGAVALIVAGRELTYGELDRRADRLARALAGLGVGPEVVVAICVERSFDVVSAALGVLAAGGAYLPIDPESPRDRVAQLLAASGAAFVLTHPELRPLVEPAGGAGPRVLCLGEDGAPAAAAAGALAGGTPAAADAGNLACVIFTSGSTGQPKGVLVEHRSLVNLIAAFARSYRPGPADRILPLSSVAFASFIGEVFPLLCTGGAVVLPQRHELLDVAALAGLIARHQVSIVSTVPAMLAGLDALGERLPRLRLLLVGGEALPAAGVAGLLARTGELRIVNGYGLTETAICSTIYDVGPAALTGPGQPPIGTPLMNQRAYVLDRHLRQLPVGCTGELYIAGDGVARGYAGRPDDTAARFLPDASGGGGRMVRTGDLAALRADGNLVYLGRRDRQVKVRGVRVELGEIEAALAAHPGVRAAAALVRGEDGEPRLVGYAVPDGGAGGTRPNAGELLAWLRQKLPAAMVPAALVLLDELPRNAHGKVDAARLPPPERARPELAAAYAAPRSALERAIAAVWREELKLPSVGLDDNFFDLGGHSLLLAKVHARLREALGRELPLLDLFQYPTIGALARHLARAAAPIAGDAGGAAPAPGGAAPGRAGDLAVIGRAADLAIIGRAADLAIIGLAGRFPGAPDAPSLWRNLVAGREGITFFTAEELIAAGVDPDLVARPDYVKAKGILGGVDLFDAAFFGLNPREVELMDPQHRVFLECSWEALEDAGWDADRFPGRIGVYAGLSMNTYLLMNLLSHLELEASADTLQASLGNDKDPLTARVSYKLNLTGPSITIQSASSTSLVAVHSACQALLNRDCDMAIAGGVSIHLPERSGYLYQEGGTVSRDGHCRAFDAASTGFVSGHGCGVVVLKRLAEAVADRDHVYAVVRGSACNNDGSHKVSFMAPSVDGQVQLYRLAYANAGVDPATVSYVECHGTGTALGDPIELAALTQAFAAHTPRRGACAIGSVKTNIGHLDTAAGVCGLIKAVLCLHHRTLPPSLHFRTPNPRLDLANSPFFVNTGLRPWEVAGGGPRRAGVTSLGMGGTNAHVVLEEAPPEAATAAAAGGRRARPWQLLALSAKSEAALDRATARLADHLRARPELQLPDVAHTLQIGRKTFRHRRALLCSDMAAAAGALEGRDPERLLTSVPSPGEHPVAFLFPGQGAQYLDMGRGLYEAEPVFREAFDRCRELLPFDLHAALYGEGTAGTAGSAAGGGGGDRAAAAARLEQTEIAQPALFAVSWAAACLWLAWGVRPSALLGHSIGEVAAACLAGVFSLEDAVALVVERGRLMQRMAPGAMLAVPLPEAEVAALLGRGGENGSGGGDGALSLAAVNRPGLCVVSGSPVAIVELAAALAARGITVRRLHTSHAFHSPTADPILEPFIAAVGRLRLSPPRIPLLSNLTGRWLLPEEATDPGYWGRQLRGTVRFSDGLALLLAEPQRILLEVGPGDTLASLAREHPARLPGQAVIASIRHPRTRADDGEVLGAAVARLWLAGGGIDWEAFGAAEERRRVSLPAYPFERQRYWVEPLPRERTAAEREAGRGRRREPRDWTYVPVWKQAPLASGPAAGSEDPGNEDLWLLLLDGAAGSHEARDATAAIDCGAALADLLAAGGRRVVRAFAGERFAQLDAATFTVAPGSAADYEALLAGLAAPPRYVAHLWALAGGGDAAGGEDSGLDSRKVLDRCFHSLLFLAQALKKSGLARPVSLAVVTGGLHEITGEEGLSPLPATALGPCAVIPRELPNVSCRAIDLLPPADGRGTAAAAAQILAEMARTAVEPWVAFRRGQRFVRVFEPLPLAGREAGAPSRLRPRGVCLITGGLGGIGLELAEHLARRGGAREGVRLVLVGRSPLPEREAWESWLAAHDEGDATRRKLCRLLDIERLGAEVLALSADVADRAAVAAVVAAAERRFGPVNAVIHAAGVPGGGLLYGRTRAAAERVLAPKVQGALAVAAAVAGRPLDFFVLASSITAVLAPPGQLDYAAANSFLDAFAAHLARRGVPAVAIAWDAWRETGMAAATQVPEELRAWREKDLEAGLSSREGVELFERIAGCGLPRVLVSTLPFDLRRERHERAGSLADLAGLAGAGDTASRTDGQGGQDGAPARAAHPRPALANSYVAPASELEGRVAAIWQEILGIEPVGLHDNFFELGGNSLAGLRVVSRLQERLEAGISEVSLYEAPTVAALARLIGGDPEAEAVGSPPALAASRGRGERRKAAQQRKRRG